MLPQPRAHGYLSTPEAQGEIVEESPLNEEGFAPCALVVPRPAPHPAPRGSGGCGGIQSLVGNFLRFI